MHGEQNERTCASLRAQVVATESQLAQLKRELASAEHVAASAKKSRADEQNDREKSRWPLLDDEYKRYGRQMIVEEIGLRGMSPSTPKLQDAADNVDDSRPVGTQIGESLDCRHGRFGLPIGNVSGRSWSRNSWTRRW